ncbi:MAG: ORF6C domain-containing protein [Ardenticatenaceae bacterium]|nr:ORF6C domain-containing protein [Anaerolineales bacterium]MCB8923659.1 ORF6C domain-containing protein [Ardenticatenaceae bacterium]MCB9005165.1 ORF6C domain-containing protein [Ardenticatenaceae bacterium]
MMAENNELVPIEQRSVDFYGDDLTAVRANDGRIYASLNQMCRVLGLNTRGQSQRTDRHAVLSRGKGVCKIHTPGGEQSVVVLRVDLVPLWLAGVRASMVNDDVRPKLERFQEEAATVLWEAFQEGRLTTDSRFEELLNQETETVQAYKMAMAIMKLARQQILLEGRLGDTEIRLDNVEERLTVMEEQLSGQDVVTEAQAAQISQAVKSVALALGKQTGRNEFGACYGEMYRRFNITSYRLLPRKKFEEAMGFLTEWLQSVVGDSPF